ncbi:retrovirus-related pol polyprotein from transposon 17.6 [Plakobranchus ocellatus]|uniref:Retrovirus-related pol polyprotein from transposon 17.6 n=1 Tax=Plakobranchus ocellatus TaxID=259542 RepID=A0AAV3ZGR1_9GAST|nr:retrovirus-related pol polyprotein from transposon 17.6 [Plakobranchus ocellatus]
MLQLLCYDNLRNKTGLVVPAAMNEIFARHVLATTKQEPGQNLVEFLQKLRALAKDCDFKQVTAEQNKKDFIRDAFICGLSSNHIRQRLLENNTLDLVTAFEKARSLEMAEKQSQTYHLPPTSVPCGGATSCPQTDSMEHSGESNIPVTAAVSAKCFFCGFQRHPRFKCPAKEET